MTTHPYTRLFSKTTAPTTNDDETLGHEVGDVWINTTADNIYDAKDVAVGAALWTLRGSGVISTGTLDARYLKLDTSNDPLQDGLRINATGTSKSGIYVSLLNSVLAEALEMRQFATTGTTIAAPFIYGLRQSSDFSPVVFNNPMLKFEQSTSSGTISGGFLQFSHNSNVIISMHPLLGGANVAYSFDTVKHHTPTGTLVSWMNSGTVMSHIDGSGTVHSNGVPLIKEAPFDSLPYVRRNRSWELAPTGSTYIPLNGWEPRSESWVRTGDHSFVMSGNHTGTYNKGLKVLYDEGGGDEFGVIGSYTYTSGSVTTVTLIPNTNFTMAGNPTSRYISRIENPEGFPTSFTFAQSYTGFSVDPTQTVKWDTKGTRIYISIQTSANGTSNATTFTMSLPVTVDGNVIDFANVRDNGAEKLGVGYAANATTTLTYYNGVFGTAFTNSGSKGGSMALSYRF